MQQSTTERADSKSDATPGRASLATGAETAPEVAWERIPTGEHALEQAAQRKASEAREPPSLEDIATRAVENKGSGKPVDPGIRAPVEAQLGAELGHARVHDDKNAHTSARAMGARAFAYREDIYLGPGESDRDAALMAHELTHVAQQTVSKRATPQAKVAVGATSSPAETEADTVAAAVTSGAPPASQGLLVEGTPGTGQMQIGAFLARLEPRVVAIANAELGAIGTATGCPYITQAFAKYRAQPAAASVALLQRWIPAARTASSVDHLEQLVLARVQSGVAQWKDRGTLPDDLAAAEPGLAAQAAASAPAAGAQRMSLDGLEGELGTGSPVDKGVADQVSRATGRDVSGARVHTGPVAAMRAAEHGATAFAVGPNIVMGSSAPAAGTAMGDALLAHELAHTAQQQEAAADPAARKKPIGDEDASAEQDADKAAEGAVAGSGTERLASFAGRVGDVMRTGLQLQRCPEPAQQKGIDRRTYLERFQSQIAADAGEHLRTLTFGTQDPSITWTGDGAKKFAEHLGKSIAAPTTPESLESIVRPEMLTSVIDHARLMDEQGSSSGVSKYFVAVGIAVGNAVARRTTESLARALPRYAQAKSAGGGSDPKADSIAISHPIDPIVVQALLATPSIVTVDQVGFKKLHPDLLGAPRLQSQSRPIEWEAVSGSTMWRRVKSPTDVTVEELATAWLGGPQEAFRITKAHPLYGVASDSRGQDMLAQDPSQELAKLGGEVADQAALAQAPGSGATGQSRARVLEQMRLSATLLKTSLKDAAVRFGPLISSPVDSAAGRIDARVERLSKADDATVASWDKQVQAQASVLSEAGKGLQADGMRLELYATQFGADLKADPGAFKLPNEHRLALFRDAELWADAIATSDLVTTARAKLAVAAQHSAVLEIEILEQSLGTATQAAHDSDGSAAVQGDFDGKTIGPREIALRKRLGQMRAQMYADPTKLDAKETTATSEEARDLTFESQVVSQAVGIEAAWQALDDADGVLSSITGDAGDLDTMKKEGKRYYGEWQAIYKLIRANKKSDARRAFEKLASNAEFQSYLKRVNDLLRSVQKHHLIATLVAMVVITVVSMGAGAVVSGLVGGSGAAATATGAVSVGLGLGRTAGAIAGFVTEAAVFSTLAHVTFTKDRTVGGFLGEFARTVVLFGAMRGIAAGFKAAGLDKITEAGFKADATFAAKVKGGGVVVGELVLNGGAGVLEAVIEARIKEAIGSGKQLTEDQLNTMIRDTVMQTLVMVLVARVAKSPLETLKVKSAFQGSRWRAAMEGHKAESRAVKALEGKATPEEVVKVTQQSQEQLKREIDALEELKTTADKDPTALQGTGLTKESLGKQIDSLRTHQTKLSALELAFSAQEIGPNHYTVPREAIVETLATHQRLSGKAPIVEATDPSTGARTWKIFAPKDGPVMRITERMPDWALTAGGKRVVEAAQSAGVDVFAMPDAQRTALRDADTALAHHDVEGATKALDAVEPTLRDRLTTSLRQQHKVVEGRKPIRNEDGSYYDGPTHDVNTLKVSQDWVSPATSEVGGKKSIPIPELANIMEKHGWKGDALEVVQEPSGSIISIDNRRIVASRMANTQAQSKGHGPALPEVPIKIYKHTDGFPPSHWDRKKIEAFDLEQNIYRRASTGELYMGKMAKGDERVHKKGDEPKTMGEAVLFRTANQGKSMSPDLYKATGGKFPLGGTTNTPHIRTPKSRDASAGSGEQE